MSQENSGTQFAAFASAVIGENILMAQTIYYLWIPISLFAEIDAADSKKTLKTNGSTRNLADAVRLSILKWHFSSLNVENATYSNPNCVKVHLAIPMRALTEFPTVTTANILIRRHMTLFFHC